MSSSYWEFLERITDYLDHWESCQQTKRSQPKHGCTCGLADLILDIHSMKNMSEMERE